MKRWQSTVLWLVGGTLALLAALALAGQLLLDTDQVTRYAQQHVRDELKRELVIDDLRLRLLPVPSLRASRVVLSNPDWAAERDMLQATDVRARIRLLPLLVGDLTIGSLSATTLELNLQADADGRRNWDFGKRSQDSSTEIDIEALAVDKFTLGWRKSSDDQSRWRANNLRVTTDSDFENVNLAAELVRNDARLQFAARIDDLSRAGRPGRTSDGEITLRDDNGTLTMRGKLPLNAEFEGYQLDLQLQTKSLQPVRRLFGMPAKAPTAPLEMTAQLREQDGKHHAKDIRLTLGKQQFNANASATLTDGRFNVQGSVDGERLDWPQARRDLGIPDAKRAANELLPADPLPWPILAALQSVDARIETRVAAVRLLDGIEMRDVRSTANISAQAIAFDDLRFGLFGGKASGALRLDPKRKRIELALVASDLMLRDWLRQHRHGTIIAHGPLKLAAAVNASGDSWKELAAGLNGPVSIGVRDWHLVSGAAQDAEALLVGLLPALAEQDSDTVRLACVDAWLPFSSGRASSDRAVGARSDASKLLLYGGVDLRSQSLDLRGRVRASKGVTLGIAALAGDVQIAGPLKKPGVNISSPGALARLGAALATSGLSVVATAFYDAATGERDPCAVVATAGAGATQAALNAAARKPAQTVQRGADKPAPTTTQRAGKSSQRVAPRSADTR